MKQQNIFFRLLETTRLLNSLRQEQQILHEILKATRYVMEVEASSLLLLDASTKELYFHTISGGSSNVREVRLKWGEGIAGWSAKHQKSVLINDVSRDPRFTNRVDKTTGFVTRNILCVPLLAENKTLGVLEAINKYRGKFTAIDRKIFMAFAAEAAAAIENARLYSLAYIDSLTNAYGRRYFESWLEKEFARAQRYHHDFSLIIFDIDHFKNINNQYGHLGGDFAIAELAKVIKSTMDSTEMLTRYGGEEFALILPQIQLKEAARIANKVRAMIENHNFLFQDQNMKVTVSIGVTSFKTSKPNNSQEMISFADEALFKAKKSGRNRVLCFPSKKL